MEVLTEGCKRLELPFIPSRGNFVTVRVGDGAEVYRRLLRRGVIVRPVAGYELPEFLRVTIGTDAENARFLEALEESHRMSADACASASWSFTASGLIGGSFALALKAAGAVGASGRRRTEPRRISRRRVGPA